MIDRTAEIRMEALIQSREQRWQWLAFRNGHLYWVKLGLSSQLEAVDDSGSETLLYLGESLVKTVDHLRCLWVCE